MRYTSSTVLARLIAWFFVGLLYAVGPLLLLIAIVSAIPTAQFVSNGIVADGTVISINRVYSRQFSKEVYKPVIRFTAFDGQIHLVMAPSNNRFRIHDQVRVIYLKDHPETARVDTIPQLWMPQIILGVLGVLLSMFSVRMFLGKSTQTRIAVGS